MYKRKERNRKYCKKQTKIDLLHVTRNINDMNKFPNVSIFYKVSYNNMK